MLRSSYCPDWLDEQHRDDQRGGLLQDRADGADEPQQVPAPYRGVQEVLGRHLRQGHRHPRPLRTGPRQHGDSPQGELIDILDSCKMSKHWLMMFMKFRVITYYTYWTSSTGAFSFLKGPNLCFLI